MNARKSCAVEEPKIAKFVLPAVIVAGGDEVARDDFEDCWLYICFVQDISRGSLCLYLHCTKLIRYNEYMINAKIWK